MGYAHGWLLAAYSYMDEVGTLDALGAYAYEVWARQVLSVHVGTYAM